MSNYVRFWWVLATVFGFLALGSFLSASWTLWLLQDQWAYTGITFSAAMVLAVIAGALAYDFD